VVDVVDTVARCRGVRRGIHRFCVSHQQAARRAAV